ncbi:YycH family protein [Paucilactobacillus vaccinostercus DSM 20634]|uniref:YycH family protein n=2 Tax=Paucilactobacillus vaccinostercus TaxID=176291 RepID=A0A0R2A0R3_9LACO|nr:YycH family protein [Paucilactobacillus vaccinostercus DSM 20634]
MYRMKEMNGTMIRKIRNNWLPIVLTIAVLVSLGLSGLIWTNPSRYDRGHEASTSSGQSQLSNKTIADVFLPNQAVWTNKKGDQKLLYTKKSSLTKAIKTKVSGWDFGHISKVASKDNQSYLGYLNQRDALVLNYPDSVTTAIFNETFKQSLNQKKISKIDRIVIPLENARHIYLLHDSDASVYSVTVKNHSSLENIRKLMQEDADQVQVSEQFLNNRIILAFDNQTTLPIYSYLMTKQSDSSFTNSLLNSDSSYNIAVHKKDHITTYTDGTDKRMTINSKNGKAAYEDFLDENDRVADSQLLTKSFQQLSEIGVNLESMHYDNINLAKNRVTYRTYVECFPIFNQDGYGTVSLTYAKNGKQTYNFSLYGLEVPVPNSATQSVPATKDVIASLNRVGIKTKDISDMRIEYEWNSTRKSNTVVNLKPAYYVKYNGKWQNYQDLINR